MPLRSPLLLLFLTLFALLLVLHPYLISNPGRLMRTISPTPLEALILEELRGYGERVRTRTELGGAPDALVTLGSVFGDVNVEDLPLPRPLLEASSLDSQQRDVTASRGIPFAALLRARPGGCLAFGAGIASDGSFEEFLATSLGCQVHGFDCTLTPSELATGRARYSFTLHRVCLGRGQQGIGGDYVRGQSTGDFVFAPLQTIRQAIASARGEMVKRPLDILKIDIEGGEWRVLGEEILNTSIPVHHLPWILVFELHTEGSNAVYVAPEAVAGMGRRQVKALITGLRGRGFHLVEFKLNPGDDKCADFVMVREREEGEGEGAWGVGRPLQPTPFPSGLGKGFYTTDSRYPSPWDAPKGL